MTHELFLQGFFIYKKGYLGRVFFPKMSFFIKNIFEKIYFFRLSTFRKKNFFRKNLFFRLSTFWSQYFVREEHNFSFLIVRYILTILAMFWCCSTIFVETEKATRFSNPSFGKGFRVTFFTKCKEHIRKN